MANTSLIVVLRGARADGNHGTIVERGVAKSDVAERERYWHDTYAPCETFALVEGAESTAIDEHRAVAPVDANARDAERAAQDAAAEAAEEARLDRIAESLGDQAPVRKGSK